MTYYTRYCVHGCCRTDARFGQKIVLVEPSAFGILTLPDGDRQSTTGIGLPKIIFGLPRHKGLV